MTQHGWQDCPAVVSGQVQGLIGDLRTILADQLIGVYLHGSLAMGCFNPLRSDVDLLVATTQPPATATQCSLIELVLRVSRAPVPVEISFLSRPCLHPWRHPTPYDLHFSEDWRTAYEQALRDGSWGDPLPRQDDDADLAGHITVAHARGVVLAGPPIADVFPVVPQEDYLASVCADVLSPQFGLDSASTNPVYVVLNVCRTLAYLETGRVLSKDEGGRWALQALPPSLHPVIAAMLDAYAHRADAGSPDPDHVQEFVAHARGQLTRRLPEAPATP